MVVCQPDIAIATEAGEFSTENKLTAWPYNSSYGIAIAAPLQDIFSLSHV